MIIPGRIRWLWLTLIVVLLDRATKEVMEWLRGAGRDASAVSAAGRALLLGGAAGNLTDRIVHGAVTDFLEVWVRFLPFSLFNPWPTFNVADAGVTIGALLLLYDVIFHPQKAKL